MKNVIKAFELKQMENNKLLILIKHEKGCVRHLLTYSTYLLFTLLNIRCPIWQ